jgi:hypothetical protein
MWGGSRTASDFTIWYKIASLCSMRSEARTSSCGAGRTDFGRQDAVLDRLLMKPDEDVKGLRAIKTHPRKPPVEASLQPGLEAGFLKRQPCDLMKPLTFVQLEVGG